MTGNAIVDRLHRFYAAGGPDAAAAVTITRDPRERPEWTVELSLNRRLVLLRSGRTLQAALSAALAALDEP